jgi:hypothetical protein
MKTRRLTVSSIYSNEKQVPAIRLILEEDEKDVAG